MGDVIPVFDQWMEPESRIISQWGEDIPIVDHRMEPESIMILQWTMPQNGTHQVQHHTMIAQ